MLLMWRRFSPLQNSDPAQALPSLRCCRKYDGLTPSKYNIASTVVAFSRSAVVAVLEVPAGPATARCQADQREKPPGPSAVKRA